MGVPLKQMGLLCAVAVTLLSVMRFFHHDEVVRLHSNQRDAFQTNVEASSARAVEYHEEPPPPPVDYDEPHFDNVDYDGVPPPKNAGTDQHAIGHTEGSGMRCCGAVVRTDAGFLCGYGGTYARAYALCDKSGCLTFGSLGLGGRAGCCDGRWAIDKAAPCLVR